MKVNGGCESSRLGPKVIDSHARKEALNNGGRRLNKKKAKTRIAVISIKNSEDIGNGDDKIMHNDNFGQKVKESPAGLRLRLGANIEKLRSPSRLRVDSTPRFKNKNLSLVSAGVRYHGLVNNRSHTTSPSRR